MLKTEAIKKFLEAKTWPDLAALYSADMEVQVNVAKGAGELQVRESKFNGREVREWTDGVQTWKPFRIPFNANTTPEYTDTDLRFSLEEHAEAIGLTGWNWRERKSMWVAYDFDAITGHSDKHSKKLTDQQLQEVQNAVEKIPFATLRYSTSGKGLHLYVFLKPVETLNHSEHAAVARSILSLMSGITGFQFADKVDVAGSNMWLYHRKMTGTSGLKVIKTGSVLEQVPLNWREHIGVVTRKRTRTLPQFISDLSTDTFEELTAQRTKVPLDEEHKRLVKWLTDSNSVWWWDQDNWMLVTHTIHLRDAHTSLGLKGKFATDSRASTAHNCFMYPIRNGAWSVRRYSKGVNEAATWEHDPKGWTHCIYNREIDLPVAAKMSGGIEHEKGGFVFRTAEAASAAMKDIGIDMRLPNFLLSRKTHIKRLKGDNKLLVQIDAEGSDDEGQLKEWLNEKKLWKRVFRFNFPGEGEVDTNETYDDLVRHVISESDGDSGWVMKRKEEWSPERMEHVKTVLRAMGNDGKDLDDILGKAIINAWKIICKPFVPEFPGDREWNMKAAQFAVPPSEDLDNLSFPTWTKVLSRCGRGIDSQIKTDPWCRENGILNGADYLSLWIASVIKHPERPAPYLGFYGPQDSGKSIFHEMLELIIVNGIKRADIALTSGGNFNGELQNTIIAVVEETDLKKNKIAYNKIKDWVTSPKIMLHIKNLTPFEVPNYCHFVHCCQELEYFPVFAGDTRVTIVKVDELSKDEKIGKTALLTMLRKEASDFLAHLLKTEIPEYNDRLSIPIIETENKKRLVESNMTPLEAFIHEHCFAVDGHTISSAEFFERFTMYLDESQRAEFPGASSVGRKLPDKFPKGKLSDMQSYYGNITFDSQAIARPPYRRHGQFITNKPEVVT